MMAKLININYSCNYNRGSNISFLFVTRSELIFMLSDDYCHVVELECNQSFFNTICDDCASNSLMY